MTKQGSMQLGAQVARRGLRSCLAFGPLVGAALAALAIPAGPAMAQSQAPAEAEDGASGIAAALELSPDVILLDVQLPDMDGFELAERDLEIRGEGQLIGARQSGLSDLRFTRLRQDQALLERARSAAATLADEGMLRDGVEVLLGASHLGES